MGVLGILAYVLGPVMKFIYTFIPNYGWTIIIFTILVRIFSLPLAISSQKQMAKMSVYQPMIQEIQTKYKNNPTKQNEELQRMQNEYGYNPAAGCMPQMINFFVLFGVIDCVYYPLQRILSISKDVLTTACEGLGLGTYNYVAETKIINAIKAGQAVPALTAEQYQTVADFNMNFMGIDLCEMPQLAFNSLIIFPVIACVTMIIANIYTMSATGSANTNPSMKFMPLIMGVWFAYFCFKVPVAFSVYYCISNILMLVQTFISHKIYDPEKMKAQYTAEIEKKKAERKKKKEVTIVNNKGEKVTVVGNEAELAKARLEFARKLDEERYKDERTTPLTEEERAALSTKKKK